MRTAKSLAAALALAACGAEEGSGGVTAEESRKLNEAAAMLDEPAGSPDQESSAEERAR